MRRAWKTTVIIALLIGLGYWGWRGLSPRPETVIRKRLIELASLASFSANEGPLAKIANSQKLSSLFGEDAELSVGIPGYQQIIHGRAGVQEAAMMARSAVSSLSVELPDITVKVAPDKLSAIANVTARVRIGSEKDDDLRELRCTFTKIDGDWLLTQAESVRTLRN